MNGKAAQPNERIQQLLADRATEGLDLSAAWELDGLLLLYPDVDVSAFEQAAAAIDLAMSPPAIEPLPASLRARVLADAKRFFTAEEDGPAVNLTTPEVKVTGPPPVNRRWGARAAWYLAAASLAFAALGWWQVLSTPRASTAVASRGYADFVRETPDVVRAPWAGKEPGFEGVSGDAVWSDASQRGFMRLVGLPPNDPTVAQYQLWIVDPSRDEHPIDGGVFDVGSAGEVVIPIEAKLRAHTPELFAITLEKPGGVVVSDGPLLVVGAVTG